MNRSEKREIMKKRFVNAMYYGTRKKNNEDTGEPCYVVGVTKKKPKNELKDEDLIPPECDVIEFPEIHELHRNIHRPMSGGTSAHMYTTDAYVGTLGLIVVDETTQTLVGLTNNHCAGSMYDPAYAIPQNGSTNTVGTDMCQPSPGDDMANSNQNIVGQVVRAVAKKFDDGTLPVNIVDGAIFSLDQVDLGWFNIYNVSNENHEFASKSEYGAGTEVTKAGRTTYVTNGSIYAVDFATNVTGSDGVSMAYFEDQIIIVGSTEFSAGGDSGSVIIDSNTNKVVGLLFAGGQDPQSGQFFTIANHIDDVRSALNISAWHGEAVVSYNTAQTVYINGQEYERVQDTSIDITHTVD